MNESLDNHSMNGTKLLIFDPHNETLYTCFIRINGVEKNISLIITIVGESIYLYLYRCMLYVCSYALLGCFLYSMLCCSVH